MYTWFYETELCFRFTYEIIQQTYFPRVSFDWAEVLLVWHSRAESTGKYLLCRILSALLRRPYVRSSLRATVLQECREGDLAFTQNSPLGGFKSRLLTGVLARVMGAQVRSLWMSQGVGQTSGAQPHALNDLMGWALRCHVCLSTAHLRCGSREDKGRRVVRADVSSIKAHQMDWFQTASKHKTFSSCEITSLKEQDVRLWDATYGLHFSVSWYLLKLQPPLKTLKALPK